MVLSSRFFFILIFFNFVFISKFKFYCYCLKFVFRRSGWLFVSCGLVDLVGLVFFLFLPFLPKYSLVVLLILLLFFAYLPNRPAIGLFCASSSSTHSRSCRAHSSRGTVPCATGAPGALSHSTCSVRRGSVSATVD